MTEPMSVARRAEIEALANDKLPYGIAGARARVRLLTGALADLLTELRRLEEEIATHEQFLELLDSAGVKMNGRGMRESLQAIRDIVACKTLSEPPAGPSEPFLDTRTVGEARPRPGGPDA